MNANIVITKGRVQQKKKNSDNYFFFVKKIRSDKSKTQNSYFFVSSCEKYEEAILHVCLQESRVSSFLLIQRTLVCSAVTQKSILQNLAQQTKSVEINEKYNVIQKMKENLAKLITT